MISFFSPAKANLYFKILFKREDGYHQIQTDIVLLDLKDTLYFTLDSKKDTLTCSDSTLPVDEHNLIIKSLHLFKKHYANPFHVHIHLDKRIPKEAGLGGGSSNAATTLYALNTLHNNPFSEDMLIEMAKQIGADVPCFFSCGRVFCEGIGQDLTLLPYQKQTFWIAKPRNISLSTADVFKELKKEDYQEDKINHLEAPAFRLQPQLKEFKDKLEKYTQDKVQMTGSGSAFLCARAPLLTLGDEAEIFEVITTFRNPFGWY